LPTLKYLARKPADLGQASPVLVMLHGYGADANDLFPLSEAFPPELLVLSVQAPLTLPFGGFAWYNLTQTQVGFREDPVSRKASENLLAAELHKLIEREGGSINDITILGFSQGAAMGYGLVIRQDPAILGVSISRMITLSGYMPDDLQAAVQPGAKLPSFFIGHGEFDALIPPKAADDAAAVLAKVNADVVKHFYPIDHGISNQELADVLNWLTSHS
jgi:phospholipase/carboxylesterase